MVYEEVRANLRARMDVDPGALVRELGDHAGQEGNLEAIEDVREALERDREHAGVGEDDLLVAQGGGVALVSRLDVRADRLAQFGQPPEHLEREEARPRAGIGVAGEPQALLYLDFEPSADPFERVLHELRHVLLLEEALLEEAGEEQVHALAGDLVGRLLRGQVDAVQMVYAAVRFVGGEQRRLDCVEFHRDMAARTVAEGGGWVKTQFSGLDNPRGMPLISPSPKEMPRWWNW